MTVIVIIGFFAVEGSTSAQLHRIIKSLTRIVVWCIFASENHYQ
jgi:hypothetical protein